MTHGKAYLMKHILSQRPLQGEPAQGNDKTQVLVVDAMPEVHNLKKEQPPQNWFTLRSISLAKSSVKLQKGITKRST